MTKVPITKCWQISTAHTFGTIFLIVCSFLNPTWIAIMFWLTKGIGNRTQLSPLRFQIFQEKSINFLTLGNLLVEGRRVSGVGLHRVGYSELLEYSGSGCSASGSVSSGLGFPQWPMAYIRPVAPHTPTHHHLVLRSPNISPPCASSGQYPLEGQMWS